MCQMMKSNDMIRKEIVNMIQVLQFAISWESWDYLQRQKSKSNKNRKISGVYEEHVDGIKCCNNWNQKMDRIVYHIERVMSDIFYATFKIHTFPSLFNFRIYWIMDYE